MTHPSDQRDPSDPFDAIDAARLARHTELLALVRDLPLDELLYDLSVLMQLAQFRAHQGRMPSITCPRCGRTSFHPKDIAERYCGHCHAFQAPERP